MNLSCGVLGELEPLNKPGGGGVKHVLLKRWRLHTVPRVWTSWRQEGASSCTNTQRAQYSQSPPCRVGQRPGTPSPRHSPQRPPECSSGSRPRPPGRCRAAPPCEEQGLQGQLNRKGVTLGRGHHELIQDESPPLTCK